MEWHWHQSIVLTETLCDLESPQVAFLPRAFKAHKTDPESFQTSTRIVKYNMC